MRACGILLPVTSLPSPYGVGCFSKEAYEFVDQLEKAGQRYWQILPLGPTGYGDSPYQSFSTFAGNPYMIDLTTLIDEGLLTQEECDACDFGSDPSCVDYGKLYLHRNELLYKAYSGSKIADNADFQAFCDENNSWLHDYAMYKAIKLQFKEKSWNEWDDDIRVRNPKALEYYEEKCKEEILFQKYLQYEFSKQWKKLKDYANGKGIEIIGDVPIYVAFDSADSWAHPELFQFDENNIPIEVAGCPPDAFSSTGQLWGNPLYDWDYHKQTNYEWWISRVAFSKNRYDIIRIDHFRGFDEYYAIPYGDATAENGRWKPGPGYDLFKTIEEKLEFTKIIAEDLGYLTDSVIELVNKTGYPGMKIIQFAFDSRETGNYMPYTYGKNSVVYTGTHDNSTLCGWYASISEEDRQKAAEYFGKSELKGEEIAWAFIRLAQSTTPDTCIIPLQDYLQLGDEARMNTPSVLGGNWNWRVQPGAVDDKLVARIRHITETYGRI